MGWGTREQNRCLLLGYPHLYHLLAQDRKTDIWRDIGEKPKSLCHPNSSQTNKTLRVTEFYKYGAKGPEVHNSPHTPGASTEQASHPPRSALPAEAPRRHPAPVPGCGSELLCAEREPGDTVTGQPLAVCGRGDGLHSGPWFPPWPIGGPGPRLTGRAAGLVKCSVNQRGSSQNPS